MKLQAQAVLRRLDQQAPLRLAGVLVAGSFYPLTAQDAWGPLHLEVGMVALAPLTPVVAPDAVTAADQAMQEAVAQWIGAEPAADAQLAWVPIERVRTVATDQDIRGLIVQMTIANEERSDETPSTPPYHRAARELERLAGLVYEATSTEERIAEDAALRRSDGHAVLPATPDEGGAT